MNFEIKELNANLAETFVDYLGNLDFGHAPHWSTCFCRYYHTNCSNEQWKSRTGEVNKAEALEQIKAGNMKGYLAFDGNKCIGWCNANDVEKFLRFEDDVKHLTKDKKVGCVICFVIHPEYRRKGVARLLLKQAIQDFKLSDFDGVLVLPLDNSDNQEKLYRGTLNMYNECGFKTIEKHENLSVMWLDLK
jgi:GNAT superfamily N-acetyltransferase